MKVALIASVLAAGLLTARASGAVAQTAAPVPPTGSQAASASARSAADLKRAETQADRQRRIGDEAFRRRDRQMKRSLGSICQGC